MSRLMEGERVLWQGRPSWRAVARDVLHVGWIAGYFAVVLIYNAAQDRLAGLGPAATLMAGVPLFGAALILCAAVCGLAYAIARTTTYVVTTERCILRYGVAITARLSVPHRRVAAVAVAVREGGAGDISLAAKPGGPRLRYIKLWPHVQPLRFSKPVIALRGVPNVIVVAELISHAAAAVSPGVLHAAPAEATPGLVGAILSPAGD